jgi:Outer membrane protein beta-barrel domain
MIRLKIVPTIVGFLAFCLYTCGAYAQGVRLFVMGAGSTLYDTNRFTVNTNDFRSAFSSGGKVIFGGEYSFTKILGFEGSYAYGPNDLRLTNTSNTSSPTTGYGMRTQRVSGDLMVHSPASFLGVRPYLSGGLEFDHFGPTSGAQSLASNSGFAGFDTTLSASNKLGLNYGGGVEWKFFPALALRFDVRDHVTGSPNFGLPNRSSSGAFFPVSGAAHNLEYAAGIVLHFGK